MATFERTDLGDFNVFLTIVRRRSFTTAAIELGLTPSAASHAMRRLEARLGAKLLNRTSRAVSPTDLGLKFAQRLEEGFDVIGSALEVLEAPGNARFGELRLNVFRDAAHLLISPALPEFARQCPDVRLTVAVDDRPIDIVAEGYDAGMRYGHHVPEDMIAVPLTGPQRWVVAGSPAYFREHGRPQTPDDLADHVCLQLLLGDNTAYRWDLGSGGEACRLRVPGLITLNDTATTITAAKAGLGLAYVLEARIAEEVAEGSLEVVLDDQASDGDPFHMYYSSRRHNHPALRTLINIIRLQNGMTRLA
ncbi:LysR family transcriptional regulator [Labrys sp. ZIDIC5]|uniref:LysR family transcriptional regulator n=1 Tax=Labrys sedimenti TaxID=3106036 RepID=UPI002ACAC29F|nr:LysR family transcriptional regulator [Labrys sp. ZIDIC5]MDZ5450040.1 LysR family transcriptional regulator [Labrys sp. ZIDIC5]